MTKGDLYISANRLGFAFHRTLPYTKDGIENAKELLDFLETQIENKQKEKKKSLLEPTK